MGVRVESEASDRVDGWGTEQKKGGGERAGDAQAKPPLSFNPFLQRREIKTGLGRLANIFQILG